MSYQQHWDPTGIWVRIGQRGYFLNYIYHTYTLTIHYSLTNSRLGGYVMSKWICSLNQNIFLYHCRKFHNTGISLICYNTNVVFDSLSVVCWPDCDSEWMEYNGHCYFRNTTLMTQPEAMVKARGLISPMFTIAKSRN